VGLLSSETAPTIAFTLEELRATHGIAAKALLIARKVFPSQTYMRLYWPSARRGKVGLAVAYLHRIAGKARQLVPALIAWRRARKASR
jgi:hypothetical protein